MGKQLSRYWQRQLNRKKGQSCRDIEGKLQKQDIYVSHSTISTFLKGKAVNDSKFSILCEYFGLNPETACANAVNDLNQLFITGQLKDWYSYPMIACRNREQKFYKVLESPNLSPPLQLVLSISTDEEDEPAHFTLEFMTFNRDIPFPSGIKFRMIRNDQTRELIPDPEQENVSIIFNTISWKIGYCEIQIIYHEEDGGTLTEYFETV